MRLHPGIFKQIFRAFPLLTTSTHTLAAPPLEICIDYHCDYQTQIKINEQQWQRLTDLFGHANTPQQEQFALKQAIAEMETIAGEQSDTWKDLAKNQGEGTEMGQLDCIAESRNTTTYLQALQQRRLLRFYETGERQRRNPWLFDFHWSAVIRDKQSGERFAVDSWFGKNGEPPIIQPLNDWLAGKVDETQQ